MSTRTNNGRHKADLSRVASISKIVTGNAGTLGKQAAVVAAVSGLAIVSSVPAHAEAPKVQRDATQAVSLTANAVTASAVTADAKAVVAYPTAPVTVEAAAPVETQSAPETPAAAEQESAPAAAQPEAAADQNAAVQTEAAPQSAPVQSGFVAQKTESAPAPKPAAASSSVGQGLVAAAYSQLGVIQDCTAMVEHALGAVGHPVGDLGPSQFIGQGTVVSDLQPGDILVWPTHVAIYVGNGQAISGGWTGAQTTVVHSLGDVAYLGGYTIVRVG